MADEVALTWIAVQIDRSRIDPAFLTKSVMPLFNATTAAGISDWPFYSVAYRPTSFRIWFSLADPHLTALLRPAIEEHFRLWLDNDLRQRALLLHYGQPHELPGDEGAAQDVAVRMLHLISDTSLRSMHYYRNDWNNETAHKLALHMAILLLKNFTPLDTEAICLLEQLFRQEVRARTPKWKELSRMQRLEQVEKWRHQMSLSCKRTHRQLSNQVVRLWHQPATAVPPALERFATIAPVLIRSFKQSLPPTTAKDPDVSLPTPKSWQLLHHFFRQIHNNLLLDEQAVLLNYALISPAIQQATSRLS